MRYFKFFLALVAIALAFFTFSVTFYPFFEIGFSTLSEQYPNSKAYIAAVMTDDAGIPLDFYIVGMDFTGKNIMIFDVPPTLFINGKELNTLYEKSGIKAIQNSFESVLKIRFTDFFEFKYSKARNFINMLAQKSVRTHGKSLEYQGSEFEETYEINKTISTIGQEGPLNMLGLYPSFSTFFKSSINISKFLRMVNFFENKPKVFLVSYPIVNSNGVIKTDTSKLKILSIELQNCSIFSEPTSLKIALVNNSSFSPRAFSYLMWNQWSKKGFKIRIVPVVCSYSLRGKNIVFELRSGQRKEETIRKILQNIYPYESFEFISLDKFKNLELYYEVEEIAAMNRYYGIGDSDFIILMGD